MRTSAIRNYGFAASIAILCTACAPRQAQGDMLQLPSIAAGTIAQSRVSAAGGGRSWMLPEAKNENLMYVSDTGEGVLVYDYRRPRFKFVGLLGLSDPEGECVDKAQDVYIANTSANGGGGILEYRHGGTAPIKVLAVDGYAENCAIDLTTGNLAVIAYQAGHGILYIFRRARGKPVPYVDSGFEMASCTYDRHGNLFVDGSVESSGVQIAELPEGGTQFQTITLNQTLSASGNVQWAGKRLAVGDAYEPAIYRFAISGSSGTEVGSTPLNNSGPLIGQFFIAGDRVIVPSDVGGYGGYVKIYDYPVGGSSNRTLSNVSIPLAVVVSYAR
jgi:hypothetical protein